MDEAVAQFAYSGALVVEHEDSQSWNGQGAVKRGLDRVLPQPLGAGGSLGGARCCIMGVVGQGVCFYPRHRVRVVGSNAPQRCRWMRCHPRIAARGRRRFAPFCVGNRCA